MLTQQQLMQTAVCDVCVTFELWDLSGGTLGQPLVAGVAGQSHCHPTAAQQKPDLLTAGVLQ